MVCGLADSVIDCGSSKINPFQDTNNRRRSRAIIRSRRMRQNLTREKIEGHVKAELLSVNR